MKMDGFFHGLRVIHGCRSKVNFTYRQCAKLASLIREGKAQTSFKQLQSLPAFSS